MATFQPRAGERLTSILKYTFPAAKEVRALLCTCSSLGRGTWHALHGGGRGGMTPQDSKRVITFSNDNDYVSFRHHVYTKARNPRPLCSCHHPCLSQGVAHVQLDHQNVELKEVGPRFEMHMCHHRPRYLARARAQLIRRIFHTCMVTSVRS
jgi:hypothetical protein